MLYLISSVEFIFRDQSNANKEPQTIDVILDFFIQIEAVFAQQVDYGSQYLTVEKAAIKRELRMFKMAGLLLGYFAFAWVPFAALEFCLVIKHMHINKWIV